jgi:hypothetical protein
MREIYLARKEAGFPGAFEGDADAQGMLMNRS